MFKMTLHATLIGATFAVVLGLGAVSAPAMAASSHGHSKDCSIGETYNGGSLADSDNSNSMTSENRRDEPCYNAGRY
jgi:hypothetical protein